MPVPKTKLSFAELVSRIINDQSVLRLLIKCDRSGVQQRITISHYNKSEIDADTSFKIEKQIVFI